MFESIYTFMTEVPVSNPALRSVITVAEILALGVCLYWFWEQVPPLFNRIRGFVTRPRAIAYEAGELDKAHFADISTESK